MLTYMAAIMLFLPTNSQTLKLQLLQFLSLKMMTFLKNLLYYSTKMALTLPSAPTVQVIPCPMAIYCSNTFHSALYVTKITRSQLHN